MQPARSISMKRFKVIKKSFAVSFGHMMMSFIQRVAPIVLVLAGFVFMVSGSARAAPQPNDRIWRLQLWLHTTNKDNAGTNDDVRIQLNDQNSTWLDSVSYTHLRAHETPEHLVCR